MPAGTITLTNGSNAVTGSGTNFTSELRVNDFIVAVVGGVTYTLGVQAIASATSLTLTNAFNGPTTSGSAWTAVPNAALVGITAQVAADVAKAIRGFNFDKVNWQKIFSSDNSVTVTMPDLMQFTGPSWGYMATQFGNKANTADVLTKADNLASLSNKITARSNLGLLSASIYDVIGTVANGNAIFESGSNSNGSYIKFADGTMICWSAYAASVAPTSAFGTLYVSSGVSLTFPAAFVGNIPRVAPAGRYGGSGSLAWCLVNSTSLAGLTMNVVGPSTNSSCIPEYIATGRWK